MITSIMLMAMALQVGGVDPVPRTEAPPADIASPITITADNVELGGSGAFEFTPDPTGFDIDPPVGDEGTAFIVRLWFDTSGKPVSCDIGRTDLPQAAQTGCDQLMKSAVFRQQPGMALGMQHGFVDVVFSFFKDTPYAGPSRQVYAMVEATYVNTAITYPPDETPDGQLLKARDGRFVAPISPDDYPSVALRGGWESRSNVLLGVDRAGAVKSCRPITSQVGPNTAYLDNYTCVALLRSGRFEFSPSAPKYEGLRYRRQSLRWAMPY